MEISQPFESLDKIALKTIAWLSEKTSEQKAETVSIALSGGNTPQALFERIVKMNSGTIDWNKVLFFWGDERCVPPTHPESNYQSAFKSLLNPLDIPQEHIFRIHGEAEPEKEAQRYSNLLSERLPMIDGFPQFDLIMLGLGEDGHTASIFQNNLDLFDTKQFCAVTQHPVSGQKRITLTGSLINHAAEIAFLVTGKSKSRVVSQIIETPRNLSYPAALVAPLSGKITWFLDKQATM